MASGSSKAKQPSQKGEVFAFPARMQAILDTPREKGSRIPPYMFECVRLLNSVVSTLLDCVPETVDIHSTKLRKALFELVQFIFVNGSLHSIIYYIGPKQAKRVYRHLDTICYRIINDKNANYSKPEFRVPAWFACILACELSLGEERKLEKAGRNINKDTQGNPRSRKEKNLELLIFSNEVRDVSPAVLSDGNNYLREKLQAPADLRTEHAVSLLASSMISIDCVLCMGISPPHRELVEPLVKTVEECAEDVSSLPLGTVQPYFLARRIANFIPLAYHLKRIIGIYSRISPPILSFDPVSVILWKAAGEFLKVLKTAVNQAKTKVLPVDYYNVANLNRLLLQCIASGVSKTVCYTEIESVSNEIDKAVAVCKDWASLDWIAEIEAELQAVEEVVLPFLQKLNPGSYKTVSVDVLDTPGFLDLYSQVVKAACPPQKQQKKVCAACGTRANELFKCNGCHSVSYCDKECQRKHWPTHKKACKEAQKRG